MINPLIHGAGLIIQRERFNEMSTLATLVVKLVGDVGDFTNKMNIVPKNVQKVARDIGKAFDMVTPIFNDVKQIVEATAGEFVRYAGQVRTVSNAIGASAEEASKLIQAADDVGLSQETLTTALLGAIKKGYKPSIANIGVLADKYNAIQDPIAKTKFLMDTFGKSGADMARLMQLGAAGIKAAGDEAERFGLVLSDKDLQAARDLEIQIDNLQDAVEGLKIKLGRELVPMLTKAVQGVNDFADNMAGTTSVADELRQALEWNATHPNHPLPQSYIDGLKEAGRAIENFNAMLEASKKLNWQHSDGLSKEQIAQLGLNSAVASATPIYESQLEVTKRLRAADVAWTTSLYSNAEALKSSMTQTDITKQALAGLQDIIKTSDAPTTLYSSAMRTAGVAAGLVSTQSIAAAQGIEILNAAYVAGKVTPAQYAAALKLIPGAAKDGIVTLADLGIKTSTTLQQSKQDILDQMGNAVIGTENKISASISATSLSIANAVSATNSLIETVENKLLAIPTDITVTIHVVMDGELPDLGGGNRAVGGPIRAGQIYNVGEHGPEPFISATNGYMLSHADAMSAVRDGGGGQGGSGLSMVFEKGAIIVNGAGDPERVAKAVLDEAGRRADARMRSR